MKKQAISFLLCFSLIFGTFLPVFAESAKLDSELTEIALIVKNTLDISDDFTQFTSSVDDYSISKIWNLNWSSSDSYVSVTADNKGKIYSYYTKANYSYDSNDYFKPVFTKDASTASRKVAEEFLGKVLDENESVVFSNYTDLARNSTTLPDYFYFNGTIQINGLNSPFKFSISVNTKTLSVVSFYRDRFNNSYVNYVPSSVPNISKDDAKPLLSTTYSFKIEYALDKNNPNLAKLYYFPDVNGNYFVDAQTGKLVDKKTLYPDNNESIPSSGEAVRDTNEEAKLSLSNKLTEIELHNISKFRDVLSKDKLDSLLKAIPELGITNYNLSTSYYTTNPNSDDVFCNLVYTSSNDYKSLGTSEEFLTKATRNYAIRKYMNVNAKTGELISFYTQYPYINDKSFTEVSYSANDYSIDFLNKYHKDAFNKTKLYKSTPSTSNTKSENFVYAQNVNGYFFTPNSLKISYNKNTGFVDSFSKTWNDKVKFDDSKNILDEKTCAKIFYDGCTINLSYISIPTPITENKELYEDYYMFTYLNKLCLAYTLENTDNIYRIDAKTGELIGNNYDSSATSFDYSDIDDCYAKDRILKLCEHGIGFEYTKLEPSKELTQLDALVLFCNALGYSFDVTNLSLDDYKSLYSTAYNYKFIKPEDKKPLKLISREELVKMLISASKYSSVLDLKNIFKCDFNDANYISDDCIAPVSVAYGLGIIVGDLNHNFNPANIATRLDACNILYNFMEK